jgi:hypothetical protein
MWCIVLGLVVVNWMQYLVKSVMLIVVGGVRGRSRARIFLRGLKGMKLVLCYADGMFFFSAFCFVRVMWDCTRGWFTVERDGSTVE